MAINKRGIFFTTLAIALVTLFFLSYTFYTVLNDYSGVHDRVDTLDSFVKGVEADLPREVYIAGFRSLVVSQKRIAETGAYLPNYAQSLEELFLNGTLQGIPESLMTGATLPELATTLQERAGKINANATLSNYTFRVYQETPWEVIFEVQAQLLVRDHGGLAQWNKTETIRAMVPVEGFEDPLYTLNTQSQIINKIKRTPHAFFVSGTNVTNLNDHAVKSYYYANPLAPSYLDRLTGSTTASAHGIESLVNLQKVSAAGITISQKSVVDYIYFSSQNPSSHRISGTPTWFYLDDAHLDTYGVSALAQ